MFSRLLLLAFLATSCAKPVRAVYPMPAKAPAYLTYPLPRPVKVPRDAHGKVIHEAKKP